MPDFTVTLVFKEITPATPPTAHTDLLFYNAEDNKLTRGWADDNGGLVLIGARNWQPTHFAEHRYPLMSAEARARHLRDNATKAPTRLAFDSYYQKYLVVQRNVTPERVMEGVVVEASNDEQEARKAWGFWCLHGEENCWYEFVLNTKARVF